jgi:chromosome segregation ATPase
VAAKRPEKTVAGMAVLNDIRGLLSATREPPAPAVRPPVQAGPDHATEISRLKKEIGLLEDQLASQQSVIAALEGERKELQQKCATALTQPRPSKPDRNTSSAELKRLEGLVRTQQATIAALDTDKRDLQAKLAELQLKPTPPAAEGLATNPDRDVSDLEAQKAELELALARIEDLIRMRVGELSRRIARVYEEAGAYGANADFRRITGHLESSREFGEFLRSLTR